MPYFQRFDSLVGYADLLMPTSTTESCLWRAFLYQNGAKNTGERLQNKSNYKVYSRSWQSCISMKTAAEEVADVAAKSSEFIFILMPLPVTFQKQDDPFQNAQISK